MYEIRKDGEVLALTEKPTYIYRHADGFYVLCGEAQAQGVALDGRAFNLLGREPMDGCETVMLLETDAGAVIANAMQESAAGAAAIETAMCDMDEANALAHADYETALCDLDEAMNGGETV